MSDAFYKSSFFHRSRYVIPESVCFLFVWNFCFFLVILVSEVGVYSSGLCVEHSIYLVLLTVAATFLNPLPPNVMHFGHVLVFLKRL